MTVVVTHTTPADGTFSAAGAAAWDADHALSGVGTLAEQDANAVAITGGTIDNTVIGGTTPAAGTFTTLTSNGLTTLTNGSGSLVIDDGGGTASTMRLIGQTVSLGRNRIYSPAQLRISTGATNSIRFNTAASSTPSGDGNLQFLVADTASAVNYLNFTGAATGSAPELSAQGSDTNINLKLTPKGTGALQVTGTGFSPNFTLTDAATIAWDTTTAGGQTATFTFVSTNRTFGAPTNLKNGAFYALAVIQNAGSNTLTWNSVFKWAAGVAPTLSTVAGAKDYFTFRSDGTNLYQQGISQAVA